MKSTICKTYTYVIYIYVCVCVYMYIFYIYIYIYIIYNCPVTENRQCVQNVWMLISAVTWRTVYEHIVADVFCSKKSSSALLVQGQQSSLKGCLSSRHSTTCGDCNRKIYENTGSVCKTSQCWKMAYQMSIYIYNIYIYI